MEVKLHATDQDLVLNDIWFILEVLRKVVQELIGIFNHFNVLPDDPDNRGFGLGIVKGLEIFANISQKAFILVRILPEDVSDDNNRLLHNVWHFSFQSFPQTLHTLIGHFLQFNGAPSHCSDGLSDELDIDLLNALL